jgi:hypothetical protein
LLLLYLGVVLEDGKGLLAFFGVLGDLLGGFLFYLLGLLLELLYSKRVK